MILRNRRLIIQVKGRHCSSDGKLPNANKGRFDVITFQLALNRSHSKVFNHTKEVINIIPKLKRVLNKSENKVFRSF